MPLHLTRQVRDPVKETTYILLIISVYGCVFCLSDYTAPQKGTNLERTELPSLHIALRPGVLGEYRGQRRRTIFGCASQLLAVVPRRIRRLGLGLKVADVKSTFLLPPPSFYFMRSCMGIYFLRAQCGCNGPPQGGAGATVGSP